MASYKQRYQAGASGGNGTVYEHVLIARTAIGGRDIPRGAEVHHVDEDKSNNTRSNLVICQSRAYHRLLHARTRIVRAGGNPNTERICGYCQALKPHHAFSRGQRRCMACVRVAARAA